MTWYKTAAEVDAERKQSLIRQVEKQRKEAEAEGVVVNGVRYAGTPANRQALREAMEYAASAEIAEFAGWKDSDRQFHADHPVADVQQALEQIAARRSALIAQEGEYVAQIMSGELDSAEGLTWS